MRDKTPLWLYNNIVHGSDGPLTGSGTRVEGRIWQILADGFGSGFLKICLCTFELVELILVRYFAHNSRVGSTILSGGSIEM